MTALSTLRCAAAKIGCTVDLCGAEFCEIEVFAPLNHRFSSGPHSLVVAADSRETTNEQLARVMLELVQADSVEPCDCGEC